MLPILLQRRHSRFNLIKLNKLNQIEFILSFFFLFLLFYYIDPIRCNCSCLPGFQGPRCQYAVSPCDAEDLPYCSSVDCFNATEFDFYSCQRKCLCCANKKCYNLGTLVTGSDGNSCTCQCFSNQYSSADNCQSVQSTCQEPTDLCYNQFGGPANCQFAFVKAECPKMCKVCS
jgi:hypothetical protein